MSRSKKKKQGKRGAPDKRAAQERGGKHGKGAPKRGDGAPLGDLATELAPAPKGSDVPRVCIVVLNMNGRHHLAGLIESLEQVDYPRDKWELLMIDNASTDGSVEELRSRYPQVRLIVNEKNRGFSGGCNQGARAAEDGFEGRGAEVLVFLNNDMRVEPEFLRELVSPIVHGEAEAVTARMYSWDGKLMNSAGGGMNFHGIGIQRGYLEPPGPEFDTPRWTLFACGGAMAMAPDVFADVGGFDEEFFAYYEDVDLGWRMWVLGHRCVYQPRARCYHHHSSTSRRLPFETIRLLQVRNPLLACFKNYDDEHLRQILPALMALAMRRMYVMSDLGDVTAFRVEEAVLSADGPLQKLVKRLRKASDPTWRLSRNAVADFIGINDLLGNWDHWQERRRAVQSRRRRADKEIFRLFLRPLWCVEGERGYTELQAGLLSFFGIDRLFADLDDLDRDPHN